VGGAAWARVDMSGWLVLVRATCGDMPECCVGVSGSQCLVDNSRPPVPEVVTDMVRCWRRRRRRRRLLLLLAAAAMARCALRGSRFADSLGPRCRSSIGSRRASGSAPRTPSPTPLSTAKRPLNRCAPLPAPRLPSTPGRALAHPAAPVASPHVGAGLHLCVDGTEPPAVAACRGACCLQ